MKCDTTKKDYKYICKNGFILDIFINDKNYKMKYKRLCAGAGQLRRNTAFFVNEELFDRLEYIMMCGLTKNRIGKIHKLLCIITNIKFIHCIQVLINSIRCNILLLQ